MAFRDPLSNRKQHAYSKIISRGGDEDYPKSLAHYKDCVLSPGIYHLAHTPLLIEGYHSLIAAFSECTHCFRIIIGIESQITTIKQWEKIGEMTISIYSVATSYSTHVGSGRFCSYISLHN